MNKQFVVAIAGTVGIGKSTLSEILAKELNFKPYYESVEDNPFLEKFYEDPQNMCYHLQSYFLSQRIEQFNKMATETENLIIDRTIYEDFNIFVKMNHNAGNISTPEFNMYQVFYNSALNNKNYIKPDLLIYLDGDFDKIMQRLEARGRQGEEKALIEYWKRMYFEYSNWINEYEESPVLRVNISEYDINDKETINLLIKRIKTKLNY